MSLDLRHLRQFVAVVEEGSFRSAAARLGMAQPPLTAAIRKIEETLGTVLIERDNRLRGLTAAGETFLREARLTLAQAQRLEAETRRVADGLEGTLRMTFVASLATGFLPAILRAYRARRPGIALELREATTAEQLRVLRSEQADLGLLVLPVEADGLQLVTVLRQRLLAAIPAEDPLAARRSLSLANLAERDWIMFPAGRGPGLHRRILEACRAVGFAPRIAQEAVQMETIAGLVSAGLGVALVPPATASVGRPGIVFRELPDAPSYEVALAFRRPSPALADLVAVAMEAGGAMGLPAQSLSPEKPSQGG